ncbi:MAG: hypothetical protein COA45_07590 [Zetaproteobacteria bacterium]|nr:MAG: hypothetical protein COA45_07590 [Zetaproteobacteria bacterium]
MSNKSDQKIGITLECVKSFVNNGVGTPPDDDSVVSLPKGQKIKNPSNGGTGLNDMGPRVLEF